MTIETKADFARRCKKTRTAVGQWIRNGLLSKDALVGEGRSQKINVEVALAQLARRLDPGQRLGNGKPKNVKVKAVKSKHASLDDDNEDDGEADYGREKARLARAQATAQEMKNSTTRGELVSIEEVERRWSDILVTARSMILAVPGRVRQANPDLTPAQFGSIDREVRHALTELSRGKAV